ncbi:MAG: hypothetical protein KAG61_00765 [Bacteriovoracaceae bacterium]|nr:hypothetical protein [Bacteriovoracaceae bacterium]
MSRLLFRFIRIFFPEKFKVQTFTYYIPSPPKRAKGYREKEFDRVLFNLLNDGLELLSINTEKDNYGMWVIATVRALRPNLVLNLEKDYSVGIDTNEEIEGIYYIQD